MYGVRSQLVLNKAPWEHGLKYMAQHNAAPKVVGGGLQLPFGRSPSCQPKGASPVSGAAPRRLGFTAGGGSQPGSCVLVLGADGLLADTRIASLLLKAPPVKGHTGSSAMCFDLPLWGARQRVLKFMWPRPVAPLARESDKEAWLVSRLVGPLQRR